MRFCRAETARPPRLQPTYHQQSPLPVRELECRTTRRAADVAGVYTSSSSFAVFFTILEARGYVQYAVRMHHAGVPSLLLLFTLFLLA